MYLNIIVGCLGFLVCAVMCFLYYLILKNE